MRWLLFSFILVTIIQSCWSNPDPRVVAHQDTLRLPSDSTAVYFPISSTSPSRWYSFYLYALHEPILYDYSGEMTIYRFTWLRTFDNPIAIRVQAGKNEIKMFLKITNGRGGYDAGQVSFDSVIIMSPPQWEHWKAMIIDADFWNIPTKIADHGGLDGSEWILEGISKSRYHWIHRWLPTYSNPHSKFQQLCDYLIKLSGLKIPPKEYY